MTDLQLDEEEPAAAEVEADKKKTGEKRAFQESDDELSGVRDNVHAQNRYAETVAGLLANINGILQTEEQMRQRYLTALDKLMEDTPLAAEAGDCRSYWENIVEILLRQMRELRELRSADLRELGMVEAPPSLHRFPPKREQKDHGKGSGWGKSTAATGGGWGGSGAPAGGS